MHARRQILAGFALSLGLLAGIAAAQEGSVAFVPGVRGTDDGLRLWLEEFGPRALSAGISAEVLTPALKTITFLPDVVDKDRRQDEFTRAVWDYLDRAVSDDRIALGQKALVQHADLLDRIEAAYGVDRAYVVAIWGLESAYGSYRGDIPVLSALGTLAYDGRRGAYFEGELLQALRMLQSGDADLAELKGSWAGASGHTQFMPTSFWNIAVDFDGDGRKNLWGQDPGDALASAAAYLQKSRWKSGEDWGFEITLPEGFDWELAGDRTQRPMAFWLSKGAARADGGEMPADRWASLLLPAGHRGPALMLFDNFGAVETYNLADAYVIAVCHLADRLRGGGPFQHPWPRDLRVLTLAERMELQQRLTLAGHSTAGVDGRVGPRTLSAIKSYQRAQGLVVDGFASTELLDRLRLAQAGNVRP
jgi:membrane-bound lytic murein transglycosylase B